MNQRSFSIATSLTDIAAFTDAPLFSHIFSLQHSLSFSMATLHVFARRTLIGLASAMA